MTRPPNPRTPGLPRWQRTVSVQTSTKRVGVCGSGLEPGHEMALRRSSLLQPDAATRRNARAQPAFTARVPRVIPSGRLVVLRGMRFGSPWG